MNEARTRGHLGGNRTGLLESTATKGERAGLFLFGNSRTVNVNKGRAESAGKTLSGPIDRKTLLETMSGPNHGNRISILA